ncbi:GNAT family N-acetyltransferase [Streptomyces sp. NBC_01304]|uniref:GNAT family N-acetyltransferase n=1 Tax=Streptomyces sp. NBC_01304 TaxID=2903818 RepID=UPI002E0EF463|nr:GNAT family N-acetyltransferase [Streptomyces sp. NBC_01304]
MRIRLATPDELPLLQAVERAAGEPFRAVGMVEIADDEPPELGVLDTFRRAGRAWVVEENAGVVAYLVAEPVDGSLHIEQVSVHPDAARRGVGRALIAYAQEYANEHGLDALTLTTFTEVPWNAPYYERLGFTVLGEAELTPGLRKVRAHEGELGLDRWPRVCMRKPLTD